MYEEPRWRLITPTEIRRPRVKVCGVCGAKHRCKDSVTKAECGTVSKYGAGCKCEKCKTAWAVYNRLRRYERKMEAEE